MCCLLNTIIVFEKVKLKVLDLWLKIFVSLLQESLTIWLWENDICMEVYVLWSEKELRGSLSVSAMHWHNPSTLSCYFEPWHLIVTIVMMIWVKLNH